MKVLIDIDKETLEWAAHKAIDKGLSRKQFLTKCIIDKKLEDLYKEALNSLPNIQFVRKPTIEENKDVTTTEVVLDPSEIVRKYTGYTEEELRERYPLTPDQSFKSKEDGK
jgi:hypothetical protein